METRRILLLCLLAVFVFAALVLCPKPAAATNDPPAGGGNVAGDWIVEDARSYSNCQINLTGNLYINTTGNLTFNNVTLKMMCVSNGQWGITVRAGGIFNITGGLVTVNNPSYECAFHVLQNGVLKLEGATISEVGWDDAAYDPSRGLFIQSDFVTINNSQFQACGAGIVLNGATLNVTNSRIQFSAGEGTTGQAIMGVIAIDGNLTLVNVTISDLTGGTGRWAPLAGYGGIGGPAVGIFTQNSTVRVDNCTIKNLLGGTGGPCANSPVQGPGDGGSAMGMECTSGSFVTVVGTQFDNITGGYPAIKPMDGSGGPGTGYGFVASDSTVYVSASNITNILSATNLGTGIGIALTNCNGTGVRGCALYRTKPPIPGPGTMAELGIRVTGDPGPASDLTIDGNDLDNMTYGIQILDSRPVVTNNSIENVSMDGIYISNSAGMVKWNSIRNPKYGVYVENGATSEVSHNDVGICTVGIYILSASGYYHNNTISNTSQDGFTFSKSIMPIVMDNNLTDIHRYGLYFSDASAFIGDNGWPQNVSYVINCIGNSNVTWNISKATDLRDTAILMRGNLTVLSGGGLSLHNSTYSIYSSGPGRFWMEVRSGGKLVLDSGSAIKKWTGSQNYVLRMFGGSDVSLKDCTVSGCGISGVPERAGPCVETTQFIYSNLTLSGSYSGLVLRTAALTVDVNSVTMTNNTYGLLCADGAKATIKQCTLANNEWALVCTNGSTVTVAGYNFGGNANGLLCADGSHADITLCTFGSLGVGISCEDGSHANVSGCNFTYSQVGLAIDNSTARVRSGSLGWNDVGIRLVGTSVLNADSLVLSSNNISLYCSGADATFVNCTLFRSYSFDALLDSGASVSFINTTYDRTKIEFFDIASILKVFWHLQVGVTWQSGAPVDTPSITVDDVNGLALWSGTGDANGSVFWLTVQEYEQTAFTLTSRTPLTVTATKSGLTGSLKFDISSSKGVDITIIDDVPPLVNIIAPQMNHLQNSSKLEVRGNASDNVLLAKLEISLDMLQWTAFDAASEWSCSLTLEDGTYTIYVRATDHVGNTRIVSVTGVTIDTKPPIVKITSPSDGLLTRNGLITVQGSTELSILVIINGVRTNSTPQGAFSITLELTADGEYTIIAMAQDLAGNWGQASITLTLDTTPPELNITSPSQNSRTNKPLATITGTVEAGAFVSVNGRTAAVNGTGWSLAGLQLSEGDNVIVVHATDAVGNVRESTIKITLDTRIILSVSFPGDNYLTTQKTLRVKGLTDPGATVKVGAVTLTADNTGHFEGDLSLAEGTNLLSFVATDDVGNTATVSLTVVLDTIAPTVEITSPANGITVKNATITISGKTEAGASVLVGSMLLEADAEGKFSVVVLLVNGANTIIVRASDGMGNTNEARLTATYKPDTAVTKPVATTNADNLGPLWSIIALIVGLAAGVGIALFLGRRKAPPAEPPVETSEPETPAYTPLPKPPEPQKKRPPVPDPEDEPDDEPDEEPDDEPEEDSEDEPEDESNGDSKAASNPKDEKPKAGDSMPPQVPSPEDDLQP